MDFQFSYYKSAKYRGKPVREGLKRNIGGWRSRWERKRDLDRKDPKKDHITKICTRGTDRDYMVTCVHGRSPDGLYFVGKPYENDVWCDRRSKGRSAVVKVKDAKECEKCPNFLQRLFRKPYF